MNKIIEFLGKPSRKPVSTKPGMSNARVMWIAWCILWAGLWAATIVGIPLAIISLLAILIPVGVRS